MPNTHVIKMSDILFNQLGEAVVDDHERTNFFPKNFNNNALAYIKFEKMMYEMAEQMSVNHKGANWVAVQCKNGKGFFMHPSNGEFLIGNDNFGSHHKVDNKTFGLLVTMMTSSHGSFAFQNHEEICRLFGDNYQQLHSHFFGLIDKFCFNEEDENKEKAAEFVTTPEQCVELTELGGAVYNYLN